MANGSMEVQRTSPVTQGIPSSIKIQEHYYGVPLIKITHVYDDRTIFQTKSRNEKPVRNISTRKRDSEKKTDEMFTSRACEQCTSNRSQRVLCADNCLSLMLPLEVELNVLGVVDQGMIDRGELAKIRRVGNRKRNSAPDISVETLPIETQKSRPKSFTSSSDLVTLLNRQSLQSTTLCSTEL